MSSSTSPILKVENLRMSFGDKEVLHGLSFEVRRGEIHGFIGPNGAGKTTTIKILATLLFPQEGNVWVDGIHLLEQPEQIRRRIGYMPDYVGVYPGLTVKEYLEFFAGAYRLHGSLRRTILSDVIELTELGNMLEIEVQVLSKGMRQRLCLAQTLIHDPDLLILDEPASGLDPRARIEFRALLKELRSMGKTVFLSSHILTELSPICDSVGIVEQGQLVASGGVEAILEGMRGESVGFVVTLVNGGVQETDAEESEGTPAKSSAAGAPPFLVALRAHPSVRDAVLKDGVLRFGYHGEQSELHSVFGILSTHGVSFYRVEREAEDLESIFMQLTRGEVS